MVRFAGVDHISFTVSDLDVTQRFYIEVLDLSRCSTSAMAGSSCILTRRFPSCQRRVRSIRPG